VVWRRQYDGLGGIFFFDRRFDWLRRGQRGRQRICLFRRRGFIVGGREDAPQGHWVAGSIGFLLGFVSVTVTTDLTPYSLLVTGVARPVVEDPVMIRLLSVCRPALAIDARSLDGCGDVHESMMWAHMESTLCYGNAMRAVFVDDKSGSRLRCGRGQARRHDAVVSTTKEVVTAIPGLVRSDFEGNVFVYVFVAVAVVEGVVVFGFGSCDELDYYKDRGSKEDVGEARLANRDTVVQVPL